MIFTTWVFAFFMCLSLVLYWVCPYKWRKYVLIILGCVFYVFSMPKYLVLIGGLSLVVYFIGLLMFKHPNNTGFPAAKQSLTIGITICVLVLFYFKYYKMLIKTLNDITALYGSSLDIVIPGVIVPLGISFFTFEFVHYLVDLYQGKINTKTVSLSTFLSFGMFFPTLVCGPIKRYQSFEEQISKQSTFEMEFILIGTYRIVVGLGKKLILADTFSQLTGVLAAPQSASWLALVVAVYAYSMKIYFDFAGYSDIAIGCSQLFGIKVPENFNWPYIARNISEFWDRWHMSLSSWIRDYLFIPLGGSRVTLFRNIVNLMMVMTICGLWHGAGWNFVAWGVWHGLGLAIFRVYKMKIAKDWIMPRIPAILLTFHFVAIGWIFFSAPNLETSLITFGKVFFII